MADFIEHKATFPAQINKLHEMLIWIRDKLDSNVFPRNDLRKIELASEEALVNIIKHGYQERKGVIKITLMLVNPKEVMIILKDQGPPFDPLKAKIKIDKTAPLEQRKEGGLGIMLIRQYMDLVQYNRNGVYNELTLIKKAS